MNNTKRWSEDHLAVLRAEYPVHGSVHVAAVLGRNRSQVIVQARKRGIPAPPVRSGAGWSEEHLALLREHYPTYMPVREIAKLVERRRDTVVAMARKLGISRPITETESGPKRLRVWTPERDQQLREALTGATNAELAEYFPATYHAISRRISRLGLGYMAQRAERIQGRRNTTRAVTWAAKRIAQQIAKEAEDKAQRAAQELVLLRQRVHEIAVARIRKRRYPPPPPRAPKWFDYPTQSVEHQLGLAAALAGRKPYCIVDANGRDAVVWRTTTPKKQRKSRALVAPVW